LNPGLPGTTFTLEAPGPLSGIAEVESPAYLIGYDGRWLLTRLEIKPGPDLLDRVKVRGYALVGSQTEETYDGTSELLGGRAGKVRAVREVQGAASGPLTTHVDLFYRDTWRRTVHARVHAMPYIWTYLDYLPSAAPGRFFSSTEPAGIPVDGVDDPPPAAPVPAWAQASLPGGTLVVHQRELTGFPYPDPGAACAPEAGATFYWRDDASFDDLSGEDGSAYGNHGVYLRCTGDTNASPYSFATTHYFLAPQDPYAAVGPDYAQREESPLGVTASFQVRGEETDARLERVERVGGGRLELGWTDAVGEDAYEIYRGELAFGDQETGQPSYYYLVVARRGVEREYGRDGSGAPRPPSSAPCP
jgi:hypothetical protein